MAWAVSRSARRTAWTRSGAQDGERQIPGETPVALVHDASTTAVMMATRADIEDLAIGFTLTEGLVDDPDAIASVDVTESKLGIEARVWLQPGRGVALAERRRHFAGPTGCGLCGIESLIEAIRPPPRVGADLRFGESDVHAAIAELAQAQSLGASTRGVHAAAWWTKASGLIAKSPSAWLRFPSVWLCPALTDQTGRSSGLSAPNVRAGSRLGSGSAPHP